MGESNSIQIGQARVDFDALTIDGPAGLISVEPKVMELLQVLTDNAGTVVKRQDLLDEVWRDNYGGDESLSRAISLLRRAFGEVRGNHQYIETVPKRGYRLIAAVTRLEAQKGSPPHREALDPGMSGKTTQGKLRWRVIVLLGMAAALMTVYFPLADRMGRATPPEAATTLTAPSEMSAEYAHKSIAVLPFTDLSSEKNQQYLADGLAEEILNALVQFPDLHVSGRSSSFSFRDTVPDFESINATLAVSHVLSGSVRKQGNRVRITARLTQTRDGFSLWSESYDGNLEDIFDLQEDIAREIARTLGVVLDLSAKKRFAPRLTGNREAYELFIQGRVLARMFGHRNKDTARELLERAVALDPDFAAAWAWLGQAHIYLTLTVGSAEIPDHIALARSAIDRALLLDPGLAIGHYANSFLLDYDLDFAASIDAHEKAYELSPGQPLLAHRRGYFRLVMGHAQDGSRLMGEALRWDPTDAIGLVNLGVAKRAIGELDEADILLRRSRDLGFEPAALQLCQRHILNQDPQAALVCWNDLSPAVRSRYQALLQAAIPWSALADAQFGDDQPARQEVLAALDSYFEQPGSHANSYLLHMYLGIGQPHRFMAVFLNRPYPLNAGALASIWDELPSSRALRQHPDFPAFVERLGMVTAWQKYGWPDKCRPFAGSDGTSGQFSCE